MTGEDRGCQRPMRKESKSAQRRGGAAGSERTRPNRRRRSRPSQTSGGQQLHVVSDSDAVNRALVLEEGVRGPATKSFDRDRRNASEKKLPSTTHAKGVATQGRQTRRTPDRVATIDKFLLREKLPTVAGPIGEERKVNRRIIDKKVDCEGVDRVGSIGLTTDDDILPARLPDLRKGKVTFAGAVGIEGTGQV